MDAREYAIWREYAGRYGLPADRAEVQRAVCGAATCSSFGGKAKPEDFMIRDQEKQELPAEIVAEVARAKARGRDRRGRN